MATVDEIPTDLALEIGVDLDPKRFVAAAREFFALVEKVVSPAEAPYRVEWSVKLREGSNILALAPTPSALSADAAIALVRVDGAVRALVSGDFAAAAWMMRHWNMPGNCLICVR